MTSERNNTDDNSTYPKVGASCSKLKQQGVMNDLAYNIDEAFKTKKTTTANIT